MASTSALDTGHDDALSAAGGDQQPPQPHLAPHQLPPQPGENGSDADFVDGHGYFAPSPHLQAVQHHAQHQLAFAQQHVQAQAQAQAQAAYLHHLAMQHQHHQHQHQQHQHQHSQQQLQHRLPLSQSVLAAARPGLPAAQQSPPPCRLFAHGYCRFGDQCRYSHSSPPASASASSSQPPLTPPPPPGLDGGGYQHQPHIHAALMQQQMEALRMQQASMHAPQHQQQQQQYMAMMARAQQHTARTTGPTAQQASDKVDQTEDKTVSDEKDGEAQATAGDRSGSHDDEQDKDIAAGGEDDSEAASTPRSTAPSSTATTSYLSSSHSSPSALSANATPFSSSFSSPSFPPSSAASSQQHSPFLVPTHAALPPGRLHSHTQHQQPPYAFNPFPSAHHALSQSHLRQQQPFSFNRHTASLVPSHLHSQSQSRSQHQPAPFDYHSAPPPRSIESRDSEREAELFGSTVVGVNFDKYDDIAVDAQGNGVLPPIAAFMDLPLPDFLQHNIDAAHYAKPTPIQKHALPNALMGRDIMACAQTGSGKTAAFLFPLIAMLLSSTPASQFVSSSISGYGRQKVYQPSGLILAPTRELATQIHDEAFKFTSFSPLSSACVYGGQDIRVQFRELDRGCDILVATPGRLMDMVDRGRISLALVRYLVLDEADRMLDMGFEPQIRAIVEGKDMVRDGRQTLMFSATFPKEIQRLAADFLYNYIFIAVGRVGSSSDSIRQTVEYVEDDDKQTALMRLLPSCSGLTLVFVERKKTADMLERYLQMHGIAASSIHGDRSQHERESALALFRSGRCPVLVATDVAARGLDIPNVTDVVNFDMPAAIDDYVHRIGRTGRAGREGSSTSFFNSKSSGVLRELVELLMENKQEVPGWLDDMCAQVGRIGGGAGRPGRGRGRWGARDFRQGQFGPSAGGRGRGGRGGFGGWRGGSMGGMAGLGGVGGPTMRQPFSSGDMVGASAGGGGFYNNGGAGYDSSGLYTGGLSGGYGAQRS